MDTKFLVGEIVVIREGSKEGMLLLDATDDGSKVLKNTGTIVGVPMLGAEDGTLLGEYRGASLGI